MMMLKKGFFQLITLALLSSIVITLIGPSTAQANPGWYNSSWQYRKKITINSANVSDTLTSFPVLASLATDSNLASDAQDDGDDILFTAADEVTKLSHEIESFDGTSGQLVAWVKIPSLSAVTDTEIYMYYGNSGASNQEDIANVWDSNYILVTHMTDDPDTSHVSDSTNNSNNGTKTAANEPIEASGNIGNGQNFDGLDDAINHGNDAGLKPNRYMTIEAWAYGDTGQIAGRYDPVTNNRSWLLYYGSSKVALHINDAGTDLPYYRETTTGTVSAGSWHHIVGVVIDAQASDKIKIYVDGLESTTNIIFGGVVNQIYAGTANLTTGKTNSGMLDEFRFSDIARSAGWIQTSYNNQSDTATFITLGSEETESVPVAIGGEIFPVDKPRVLAPWLILLLVTSLVTIGGIFQFRKSTEKDRFY